MVRRLLDGLFGRGELRAGPPARARVTIAERPAVTYAIGDVHGCLDELLRLERMIVDDAVGVAGDKLIVMVGDYVDRGPYSAQVLDHLVAAPPSDFRRIALAGNHEQMLLDFLDRPRASYWLENGGNETLRSYGIAPDLIMRGDPVALATALGGRMPDEHRRFLTGLPVMATAPGFIFVHAGLRPGVTVERQSDEDLLWTRELFVWDGPAEFIVVHGHTPGSQPRVTPATIGIDTAAFDTGRLTALRIDEKGAWSFLST